MTALSPRELEVAQLVARGWRNAQIAGELDIQLVTVKNHIAKIFKKLNVVNRTQLALFVYETAA